LRITIDDVARLAGVAKSTVSRVINDSGPVSEITKKRVLDTIDLLKYKPDALAVNLAKQETHTIGVLVPDIRNPFYANACWAAEKFARSQQYAVLICNSDNDPKIEQFLFDFFQERRVDYLLSIGGSNDLTNIVNFAVSGTIPVVSVDRKIVGYNIPSLTFNNFAGGVMIAEHLLKAGHTRIAFATSDFTPAEVERRQGFEFALAKAGCPLDPRLTFVYTEEEWKEGKMLSLTAALKSNNRPTAIFTSNDLKAIAVYAIIYKMGLTIPKDISIIGYDDIDTAQFMRPPLSTVYQPIEEAIYKGVEILLSFDKTTRKENYLYEPRLIIRESLNSFDSGGKPE
jgi:LacI family transcriptional regulator